MWIHILFFSPLLPSCCIVCAAAHSNPRRVQTNHPMSVTCFQGVTKYGCVAIMEQSKKHNNIMIIISLLLHNIYVHQVYCIDTLSLSNTWQCKTHNIKLVRQNSHRSCRVYTHTHHISVLVYKYYTSDLTYIYNKCVFTNIFIGSEWYTHVPELIYIMWPMWYSKQVLTRQLSIDDAHSHWC